MTTRLKRRWPPWARAIVLFLCISVALRIVGVAGILRFDQHRDRHATIGVIFDPFTLLNVHASNAHYIRVARKTYTYHDGVAPGYFYCRDGDLTVFFTKPEPYGDETMHIRDGTTGEVADVSGVAGLSLLRRAVCGVCGGRAWVHERSGSAITFGATAPTDGGTQIELTTVDLVNHGIVGVKWFLFTPDEVAGKKVGDHPQLPAGTTFEAFIGAHRVDAGLPER